MGSNLRVIGLRKERPGVKGRGMILSDETVLKFTGGGCTHLQIFEKPLNLTLLLGGGGDGVMKKKKNH